MDLMSATTTYDALVKKYSNFMVPAMKLKINGINIAALDCVHVTNVSIQMSVNRSSNASFTIDGAYDLVTHSFNPMVTSMVKLGSVIEIELGYGSSTTACFKGYIAEISYDFQDAPSISVTALDVCKLMMECKRGHLNYSETTYSDMFNQVMKKYAKVYSKLEVDATSDTIKLVTQNHTDYNFVKQVLCKMADREFFCVAGTVYFRKPEKNPSPIMTLEWGKSLISFNLRTSYFNKKVKVHSIGISEKEAVSSEVSEKADGQIPVTLEPLIVEEFSPSTGDAKKAKDIAASIINEQKAKAEGGSASCIGIPEIVPGRYITVAKLDSTIDRNVYIKSVSHSFGNDGFSTKFDIGGW